jgi:hypothetical protein
MTVVLEVRRPRGNYGCAYVPEVEKYVGEIIPNPKWLANDSICLTTGQPDFTFRIIKKSQILSSNVHIEPSTVVSANREFQVAGSKGNTYTVKQEGTQWSCTCVGFGFRRDCKHINQAKKEQ